MTGARMKERASRPAQGLQETLAVRVVSEDRVSVAAPHHDRIDRARILDSPGSRPKNNHSGGQQPVGQTRNANIIGLINIKGG